MLQLSAGTRHDAGEQGVHETTQSPFPSEVVCTLSGASGPRAGVVKETAVDEVCWALMYAVTTARYTVAGLSPVKRSCV